MEELEQLDYGDVLACDGDAMLTTGGIAVNVLINARRNERAETAAYQRPSRSLNHPSALPIHAVHFTTFSLKITSETATDISFRRGHDQRDFAG